MEKIIVLPLLAILIVSSIPLAQGQELIAKYEFKYNLSVLEYKMKENTKEGIISGTIVSGYFSQKAHFNNGTKIREGEKNGSDMIDFVVNEPNDQFFYKFFFSLSFPSNQSDFMSIDLTEQFVIVLENGTTRNYPGFNVSLPQDTLEGDNCIKENRLESICSMVVDNPYWFFDMSVSIKREGSNDDDRNMFFLAVIGFFMLTGWIIVFIIYIKKHESRQSFFD